MPAAVTEEKKNTALYQLKANGTVQTLNFQEEILGPRALNI
jgi:hypothetical protein